MESGYTLEEYDVAVIGAGHAGCEAALAAARLGLKTAIFTLSLDCLHNMPCNPCIGGSAKGQIVCEIDSLGGEGKGGGRDLYTVQDTEPRKRTGSPQSQGAERPC